MYKYRCSPPQPVLFLFQAFYYDLDKVRLLGMRWNVASRGKWVIFCLLRYLMTHLGNNFSHPFFSVCPLRKQIRSVERYIRKLEFHISKVRGLYLLPVRLTLLCK